MEVSGGEEEEERVECSSGGAEEERWRSQEREGFKPRERNRGKRLRWKDLESNQGDRGGDKHEKHHTRSRDRERFRYNPDSDSDSSSSFVYSDSHLLSLSDFYRYGIDGYYNLVVAEAKIKRERRFKEEGSILRGPLKNMV